MLLTLFQKAALLIIQLSLMFCVIIITACIWDYLNTKLLNYQPIIISVCMLTTFCNLLYLFVHVYKTKPDNWTVSFNIFLYVLSQLISIITILTDFDKFILRWLIIGTTLILFVLLFLLNFFLNRIFEYYQQLIEQEEVRTESCLTKQRELEEGCITIRLYEAGVNQQANTSKYVM